MELRLVVAATNSEGSPDFFTCILRCTREEYDDGECYDAARELALRAGYEGEMVAFDENDGPEWLFAHFDWSRKPIRTITFLI